MIVSATSSRSVAAEIVFSVLLFAGACAAGLAILVALFKSGLLGSIDILFYRGLLLCAAAAVLTIALAAVAVKRTGFGTLRDAISAGVLSLGVNLTVLVILPVTVDRSVSVFVLSYMNAHASDALSPDEVDAGFRNIYLGHLQQIDRRLKEQTTSGNLIEKDGRYTISAQGKAFMRTADWIAWMFDTDRRLIDRKPEIEESGVAGSSKHHVQ